MWLRQVKSVQKWNNNNNGNNDYDTDDYDGDDVDNNNDYGDRSLRLGPWLLESRDRGFETYLNRGCVSLCRAVLWK
jgi:hypothetical protein